MILKSLVLLFFFMAPLANAFDQSVHNKIQSWHSPAGDMVMTYGERFGGLVAPAMGIFPYLAASANTAYTISDDEYSRKISMWRDVSRAFFASTLIVWSGKVIIGRARPYLAEGAYTFKPFSITDSNWHSFPSGHTASAFSVASALAEWNPNLFLKVFLYGSATLTAYARMYEGKHWLSDVIVGGAIGYFAGKWSVRYGKGKKKQSRFFYATPSGVGMVAKF